MHLLIEGHGIRTVALLGAIQWMQQTGRMERVDSITCYSFGSIIGAAIALRRPPREVLERLERQRGRGGHIAALRHQREHGQCVGARGRHGGCERRQPGGGRQQPSH